MTLAMPATAPSLRSVSTPAPIDLAAIFRQCEAGYIKAVRHPFLPLTLFNYTQKAQFEGHWTRETLQCRGLILNDAGEVMARPFPKFFNYEQVKDQIPMGEPFTVSEKLDGSLGILYWDGDLPCLATRGSFTSEQALRGTEMLRALVPGNWRPANVLDRLFTFLFEIIYPENKIVVDYGKASKLVLLAAIDRQTGIEWPELCDALPFERPRRIPADKVEQLLGVDIPNEEGFVVHFEGGMRVKIKMADYCRLHRMLTGVSAKAIWEHLRDGRPFEEIVERAPDEFHAWAAQIRDELVGQYIAIEGQAQKDMTGVRRAIAEYFKTCANPSILFSMLDGKPYDQAIWKLLRPEGARAFRCDGGEG